MSSFILEALFAVAQRGRRQATAALGRLGRGYGACLLLPAFVAQAQSTAPPVGTPGLTVDYYRGYFYGKPAFFTSTVPAIHNRPVEQLNFVEAETDNFAVGNVATYYAPGNPDEFSGRFQGQLYATTAGTYTFYLGSDDAAYLWVDNNAQPIALNSSDAFSFREATGVLALAAGLHTVRVDYGEHGGSQGLVLQYAGPGMPKQLVPNGVLYSQGEAIQPVLMRFEAVANDQQVQLDWATAAEANSTAFVVQKSTDGVTFSDLLRQPGAGTTSATTSYAATDQQPANGRNFYRIEQIRSDRPPVYSPVKVVEIVPMPFAVSIYPVPNNGTFFVRVQPASAGPALLEIVDMIGRHVYRQQVPLQGSAPQLINPNLAIGMYILRLTTSAGTLVQKMPLGG
ncbi:PA14 domain-containing protein [Hymenobacter caeli]|uniref:PA14 domain-containing protein n=1 Tax=Hymenobacter caeli TaxID=2735894 RepID=A0ABX2FS87_9BACT|nr:PA14 domain-containing protein [Hymenobacter caeli]NRT20056.1 hypothetical protein [Hymenobacter caeli]